MTMITLKYLNFINENAETKTDLDTLVSNINKLNKPRMDKKSKILKDISVTKTADDQVIEQDGIYYTLFDSSTLKNGTKVKEIKINVQFDKGYLTYTVRGRNTAPSTPNKIYGYLIVKDKTKTDILNGVELLVSHKKYLESKMEKPKPITDTTKQTDVKKQPVVDKQTNVNTPIDKSKTDNPPVVDTTNKKGTTTEQPIVDKKVKPKSNLI
jgi:hypothetical protein